MESVQEPPISPLHVAVVTADDGVLLVAAGTTTAAVAEQLAGYVASRADHGLWPADAERVAACLRAGDSEGAIRAYFTAVGGRWDGEQLHWQPAVPGGSPTPDA
jgi:hypothetical protein